MIETAANDWEPTDMITVEEAIGLSFGCQPAYMSSSLMALRTRFEVS